MSRLIILRGISGSGKSTWADVQAGHPVIVSRDRIRMAAFGSEDFIDEDFITKVEHSMIEAGLLAGRDVIVDNTGIMFKYVKAQAAIGYRLGAEVEVKVFNVDLKTALARNAARGEAGGRFVPEDVIRKQHTRLRATIGLELEPPVEVKPYTGTPGKPKALMVDIDGTLAHMVSRGPFDWKRVGEDAVDVAVAELVSMVAMASNELVEPWHIIIMSGRDEVCRKETKDWLDDNLDCYYDLLFMRPEGDNRKDNIVKAELFDEHIRDNFDVQFVLDDRDQVVRMWRAMGIKCLQVAPGNF